MTVLALATFGYVTRNRNNPICVASLKVAKASTIVTVACCCHQCYRGHYCSKLRQCKDSLRLSLCLSLGLTSGVLAKVFPVWFQVWKRGAEEAVGRRLRVDQGREREENGGSRGTQSEVAWQPFLQFYSTWKRSFFFFKRDSRLCIFTVIKKVRLYHFEGLWFRPVDL